MTKNRAIMELKSILRYHSKQLCEGDLEGVEYAIKELEQRHTVAEIRHYCQERLSILRDLEKEHGGYNFQIGEFDDLLEFIDGKDTAE